jgi:hypothetical protein
MIVLAPMGAASRLGGYNGQRVQDIKKSPNEWASKLFALRDNYGVFDMINPIFNVSFIISKSSF